MFYNKKVGCLWGINLQALKGTLLPLIDNRLNRCSSLD